MKPLRAHAWALAVFAVALALRVGFVFVYDQPLLYAHQYHYFTGALRIAEHPQPWQYVLHSDEWRTWDVHWTIAPLYYLFAAVVLKLSHGLLLPLQLVHCAFDALVAVLVAGLGRTLAGPRGAWAGFAYAVHWTAVDLPSWTMTENLHTLLLVGGAVLVAHEPAGAAQAAGSGWRRFLVSPTGRRLLLAGVIFGLSALTRSVTSAFLLLLGAWQVVRHGRRAGWMRAVVLVGAGLVVILPWSARNFFLLGERVPIETTAYENMLWANHLGTPEEYRAALEEIGRQRTPAAKRELAMRLALEGIRNHPGRFVEKVNRNFWHFVRPEGLDGLLRVERTVEPWGHLKTIVGDDLLLLVALPLFAVFVFAGRRSPQRDVILIWSVYYLSMVIVAFHNEVRYRSALAPFVLAAAAGGAALLGDPAERRRWRTWLALALGLYVVAASVAPYVEPARRARAGLGALRQANAAADRGEFEDARALLADGWPRSAWPWTLHARHLARTGRWPAAVAAYEEALTRATPLHVAPHLALPRAYAQSGRRAKAAITVRTADNISWVQDPWFALEIAWAELPPPRTDEIALGAGTADYGAVRGFLHPRGGDPRLSRGRMWSDYERLDGEPPPGPHRWSRHRAWLRLLPQTEAAEYDVTVWMGVPFPSTLESAAVDVSVGAASARFTVGREVRAYTLRVAAPAVGVPLVVQLDGPAWSRAGQPADQGVRVDRLVVVPAGATVAVE